MPGESREGVKEDYDTQMLKDSPRQQKMKVLQGFGHRAREKARGGHRALGAVSNSARGQFTSILTFCSCRRPQRVKRSR